MPVLAGPFFQGFRDGVPVVWVRQLGAEWVELQWCLARGPPNALLLDPPGVSR